MPWHASEEDGKVYKYQYHPHGDKNQPLRAAPSAMNTVIVPNVTLPEVRDIPSSGLRATAGFVFEKLSSMNIPYDL